MSVFGLFLAFWISDLCLKIVFDALDNLVPSQYDITVANEIMCRHFQVSARQSLNDPSNILHS